MTELFDLTEIDDVVKAHLRERYPIPTHGRADLDRLRDRVIKEAVETWTLAGTFHEGRQKVDAMRAASWEGATRLEEKEHEAFQRRARGPADDQVHSVLSRSFGAILHYNKATIHAIARPRVMAQSYALVLAIGDATGEIPKLHGRPVESSSDRAHKSRPQGVGRTRKDHAVFVLDLNLDNRKVETWGEINRLIENAAGETALPFPGTATKGESVQTQARRLLKARFGVVPKPAGFVAALRDREAEIRAF
ncbi:hypothetical protein [Rubrivirga sp. IMCC43871]|uniref:hypothetical protein n=1 Tax=Rubrivirga sp. IMCC43871 TaxID=3391575 RepID=UPI0039903461